MKLSTALLATLPRRELRAVLDTGCVSKADQLAISALRGGDAIGGGDIAKQRIYGTIRKQFAGHDRTISKLQTAIYDYARESFEKETTMTTATDLLEERVSKARDQQAMLRDAIPKHQAAHPGRSCADAIDAVLFSPEVKKTIQLEMQLDELAKAKNTLPQQKPGTMMARHNDAAPTRGCTGYDSSVDGRPPHNPDDGEEPIIHDHHQLLEDIKSGKMPFSDPRVSECARHGHQQKPRFALDGQHGNATPTSCNLRQIFQDNRNDKQFSAAKVGRRANIMP